MKAIALSVVLAALPVSGWAQGPEDPAFDYADAAIQLMMMSRLCQDHLGESQFDLTRHTATMVVQQALAMNEDEAVLYVAKLEAKFEVDAAKMKDRPQLTLEACQTLLSRLRHEVRIVKAKFNQSPGKRR